VVSTVTLPPDVSFVATSGCPTDPAGIPACGLGTITSGATASYTITTKVTTFLPGTLMLTATATSTTPLVNPANDTDTETTTVELQRATVGLFDPATAIWYLADSIGEVTVAGFGNPGDLPVVGDWDGNESDTVGLYRPSDGFFYGRNRNTSGIAEFTCFAGNPEDMAVSGDWDGDGTDTLGIYRPSEQKFYLFNKVCVGAPMGAAGISFAFGNPGDLPIAGDFDGDGSAEVGLFRKSTGFVYYRNTLTTGIADVSFYWGNPDDLVVSGDWNANGTDTPGLYRPSDITFYLRNTNTQGNADLTIPFPGGQSDWLAVAGSFGLG
jgi:hypothetical protein